MRASIHRWTATRDLIAQLQRMVRVNAQIDLGIKGDWRGRMEQAGHAEDELEALSILVQKEISRLTCEKLQDDHERRVRRDAKRKRAQK